MKKIYQKLLEGIPDYKEFLTVEEMNSSSKTGRRASGERIYI